MLGVLLGLAVFIILIAYAAKKWGITYAVNQLKQENDREIERREKETEKRKQDTDDKINQIREDTVNKNSELQEQLLKDMKALKPEHAIALQERLRIRKEKGSK